MPSSALARRASDAWLSRMQQWTNAWRQHRALGDTVLAAGLLLALVTWSTPAVTDPQGDLAEPLITLGGHWRDVWWSWVLQLALVLPLARRRRAPLAVFLAIAAVAFVQWLAGPELYGDLAVLIALYTVAAHEPRRWTVVAASGIGLLGLALATLRWAEGSLATGIALVAMIAVPVALGLAVRARRRALLATHEAAARVERARISREMHDIVAHNLSVMIALADGARMTVGRDRTEAEAAITQVARSGRDALAEMRLLLGVVSEPEDEAPLHPQPGIDELPGLVASIRSAGIDVRLDLQPGDQLPAAVGLTIHRIVQESLTNVLKHAPTASRAEVAVRRSGSDLTVEVLDDGRAAPAPANGDARGLRGMAERVALHGGRLDAGPAADGGWRVHAALSIDGSAS